MSAAANWDDSAADPGRVSGDVGQVRELTVPPGAQKMRLDLFLTQVLDGYSREQIRRAVQDGGAEVDGRVLRPSYRLKEGQRVRFTVPEPVADGPVPEPIPLEVVYEDDLLVVINKPAGMVVHPARGHWTGTLTSALAHHFQALSDIGGPTRPGIVHRLDRDTSGVIMVAKTNAAHMKLSAQWADRTVAKEYLAITSGVPDRDRDWIRQPIGHHPYSREKMAIRSGHSTSREAETFYEVQQRFHRYALVKALPKTGRTHQIRVHLDHIRCPVLCDKLYGGRSMITAGQLRGEQDAEGRPLLARQALHASRLEIEHPKTGERMVFEAPLPVDMQRVLDELERTEGA